MDRALAITGVTGIAVLAAIASVAAASCSGSDATTSPIDHDARAPIDAKSPADAGGTLDSGIGSTGPNIDGWLPVDGFDSACQLFYAPSSAAKNFPPPVAWETCDPRVTAHASNAGAPVCRQMATTWDSGVAPDSGFSTTGYVSSAFVDPTTQVVTATVLRAWGQYSLNLVAEMDGPVHQAITSLPPVCDLGAFASISQKNVVYHVEKYSTDGKMKTLRAGALGGPFDGAPKILRVYDNLAGIDYVAGASEFVEVGAAGFDTGSWTDGHKLAPITTSAAGQLDELQFQGDNLFFGMNDLQQGTVEMFAPDAGTVDFVSFGSTPERQAADFATDGKDMVWVEASGHPDPSGPWTKIDIVTAPYTTNPASIVKRRLRSETSPPGATKFVVGCGYAAHEFSDATSSGVRLVRLSDGVSWALRNNAEGTPYFAWNDAVAISCTEMFINFNFGAQNGNLARIRLDSLGPGQQPD